MKKYKYIGICFLILFSACKSLKNQTDKKNEKTLKTKELLKKIKKNEGTAKTLHINGTLAYKKLPKAKIHIQILKNKKIGIKISHFFMGTVAKILMTPETFSYYATMQKTYYKGNYEVLEERLDAPVGFKKIQNILLGAPLLAMENFKIKTKRIENAYEMQSKTTEKLFFKMLVHAENFKIKEQKWTLSKEMEAKNIRIVYAKRKNIGENNLPFLIKISVFQGQKNKANIANIEFSYKNITADAPFDFSYQIPEGYELQK